jgi:hypothetical protein
MHGPEHWLGLLRAWLVVGVFVSVVWSVLDAVRAVGADLVGSLSERR